MVFAKTNTKKYSKRPDKDMTRACLYTNVSLIDGFCKNKYKEIFKEVRKRQDKGLYCIQMYHEYTVSLTPALCHRVGTNDHIRQ